MREVVLLSAAVAVHAVCTDYMTESLCGADSTCVWANSACGTAGVVDECTTECWTCAQKGSVHTCTQAGQKCVDHNKSPDSLSDWSCVCEVGKGEAALHAAVCMIDECLLNGVTCEGRGQECVDPDMRVEKSGDWVCQCIAPASGKAVVGPASCLLDECNVYGGNCTVAGQLCIDHNTAPASLGDWTCNCPAPAVGVGYAGPASCAYIGACKVAANLNVCADAGQRCISGDSSDDFTCACMPPYHGTAGERAPAQCVIDECEDICATCARTSASAMNVCVGAGQRCEDPNLSVQSLGDWVCMCQAPSTTATVARAVNSCLVDECLDVTMTGARKCDNFKRYTNDGCECACGWMVTGIDGSGAGLSEPCNTGCCNPDRAKEGDWCLVADSAFNKQSAVCTALISKQKTCANERAPAPAGAPVSEFVDVCAAAGQRCSDPNHSPFAQGDWECHCTTSSDYHVLGPAKCSMLSCFVSVFLNISFCGHVSPHLLLPHTSVQAHEQHTHNLCTNTQPLTSASRSPFARRLGRSAWTGTPIQVRRTTGSASVCQEAGRRSWLLQRVVCAKPMYFLTFPPLSSSVSLFTSTHNELHCHDFHLVILYVQIFGNVPHIGVSQETFFQTHPQQCSAATTSARLRPTSRPAWTLDSTALTRTLSWRATGCATAQTPTCRRHLALRGLLSV